MWSEVNKGSDDSTLARGSEVRRSLRSFCLGNEVNSNSQGLCNDQLLAYTDLNHLSKGLVLIPIPKTDATMSKGHSQSCDNAYSDV